MRNVRCLDVWRTPTNQETTVETSKKKEKKKRKKEKKQQQKCRRNHFFNCLFLGFVPFGNWAERAVARCRHTHTQCCFQLGLSASGFRCCCSTVCLPLRWTHIGTRPPPHGMATPKATVAAVIISFFHFLFLFFRSNYWICKSQILTNEMT
jgi:hypothetical protein